ncbi:NAD(P)H-dependent oxidoreductase [Carboxylicivirga marina]|uniref:NAD(P)H-dependent oxidoreductase n=1 Tax=Carboxylicivirga marina TaxID=2800988 RepID=A0ABS1HJT4_9BACT|nr:NAD(P)H-dependent oxidoreductase [Carboxylicivirga marina]MBK3517725.1 NAD(P)H-dependent oxidoreductase [Carboxylicivirga marina]
MNIIEQLNWRYATKEFDASKKLTEEQLDLLLEATNLAPSSFGLQPFQMLVIENDDIKQQLKAAAWNQPQTTDASHLILFVIKTDLTDKDVDAFLKNISEVRNIPLDALAEYEKKMKGFVNQMPKEELLNWQAKQAYIAIGQLMVAAAVEGIDTCPMEGFDKNEFDKILQLKEKNLTSVVMAAIGFRSASDKYQHLPKVRKSLNEMVIKL